MKSPRYPLACAIAALLLATPALHAQGPLAERQLQYAPIDVLRVAEPGGTPGPTPHVQLLATGAPVARSAPQAFLGVVTAEVPPSLSTQLGLPEGFGLLVQEVLPDSPALAAGVEKHDILRAFNDQQLIQPEQLLVLVRAAGKGNAVTLTVVRRGAEKKLQVTLNERVMGADPFHSPFPSFPGAAGGPAFQPLPALPDHGPGSLGDHVHKWHDTVQRQIDRHSATVRPLPGVGDEGLGGGEATPFATPLNLAHDLARASSSSEARVVLKDGDGELEVVTRNGKRTVVAKSPDGTIVHQGGLDSDAERQAVPPPFREKLDRIQVQSSTAGSKPPEPAKPSEAGR